MKPRVVLRLLCPLALAAVLPAAAQVERLEITRRSPSLETLLPRARADELRAGRWLAAAVAGLALLHLYAVAPFVASAEGRSAARADLERLAAVAGELGALEPHVSGPARAVDEDMAPALGRLVDDVRQDLVRLRATLGWLRAFVAAQRGEGETPDRSAEDVEVFAVENVDRILAVAEASTRDELLAALAPVAESHVANPRFSDLRELWRSTARPRLEASLDAVAGGLPELRGRWAAAAGTDAAGAWDELGTALAAARRTVRDLEWRPPERADWWTSAAPEGDELLSLALDPAVEEQLRRPLAADQLRVALTRAQDAFRAVADAVERRRQELSRQTDGGGLPGLAGPQVETVVRGFPLVLGLVLAAALGAAARRRRELGWITHLLIERGDAALGDWYFARPRWGVASGLPEHAPAAAARAGVLRIVFLGALGLGWIGFAVYQLRDLEPHVRLLAVTAVGAAAFLAAVAYDAAVVRGLHRLLAPAAEEIAVSVREFFPEEQDEEEGVVDEHTLRR